VINFKLFPLTDKQKVFWGFITVALIVAVIYTISSRFPPKPSSNFTDTIPVIPIADTNQENNLITLDPVKILNPEQKISFNWGNIAPPIPESMEVYTINIPIVNDAIISNLISKLGFSNQDKQVGMPTGDIQLINNGGSLFASIKTNQISYFSNSILPQHTLNLSKDQAINSAREIISSLFGELFVSTLDNSPEVRHVIHLSTDVEIEPRDASVETANAVIISFRQDVHNFPIMSLSSKGEVISLILDTTNKLYSLLVSGGYQKITETKKTPLIDFAKLQENASIYSLRISHSKDMGSERGYTDVKQVKVVVKSVDLGYFQFNNSILSPIFIISGTMSAKGLIDYPAIYIIPATK
jgi:hypothetical protein